MIVASVLPSLYYRKTNSSDNSIIMLLDYFFLPELSCVVQVTVTTEFESNQSQQTRDIHLRLVQCWASVVDDGLTLNRHWPIWGMSRVFWITILFGCCLLSARAGAQVQLPAWKSEIAGLNPSLASKIQRSKFQRNKMFPSCSLVMIQYCREPQWPRGREVGNRAPGFEFWNLEGSAISFISPSSGGSPDPV